MSHLRVAVPASANDHNSMHARLAWALRFWRTVSEVMGSTVAALETQTLRDQPLPAIRNRSVTDLKYLAITIFTAIL